MYKKGNKYKNTGIQQHMEVQIPHIPYHLIGMWGPSQGETDYETITPFLELFKHFRQHKYSQQPLHPDHHGTIDIHTCTYREYLN